MMVPDENLVKIGQTVDHYRIIALALSELATNLPKYWFIMKYYIKKF